MTADIRANVFCSLGPIIEGSVSDNALTAGMGLVTCRGQVVLAGLHTPVVGSLVHFGWSNQTTVSRIPRTLRVLSSFADPFKGITTVQLGDKLYYLSNLVGQKFEPDPDDTSNSGPDGRNYPKSLYDWTGICYMPRDDGYHYDFSTREKASKVTWAEVYAYHPWSKVKNKPLGIPANFVLSKCCAALGIQYQGSLQNRYQDGFDLSSGYVSGVDKLLNSESLFGYLDEQERLIIRELENGQPGPLIASQDIIELYGLNQGILPGQTVSVVYSTRRLKPNTAELIEQEDQQIASAKAVLADPNSSLLAKAAAQDTLDRLNAEATRRNWELEESTTYGAHYPFIFDDGEKRDVLSFYDNPYTRVETKYDGDYVSKRTTLDRTIVAAEAGSIIQNVLTSVNTNPDALGTSRRNLGTAGGAQIYFVTKEEYEYELIPDPTKYPDPATTRICSSGDGQRTIDALKTEAAKEQPMRVSEKKVTKQDPNISLLGKLNLSGYDWAENGFTSFPDGSYVSEIEHTTYEYNESGGQVKTVTTVQKAFALTIAGQQMLAEAGAEVTTYAGVIELMQRASALVYDYTTVRVVKDRQYGIQRRPSQAQRAADAFNKGKQLGATDENGLGAVEVTQETTEVPTTQGVQFAVPFSSDDTVEWSTTNGDQFIGSNAMSMALKYARTTNAILRGNRNGVALTLPAYLMPLYPLSSVYVNGAGFSTCYLSNAMSWSFDANGIICAMDALFVAGVGGDGTRWALAAPSFTGTPSSPPVITGTSSPANSVPIPQGFDPTAVGSIFEILPSGQPPTYSQSYGQTTLIPAFDERIPVVAGSRSYLVANSYPYAPTVAPESAVITTRNTLTDYRSVFGASAAATLSVAAATLSAGNGGGGGGGPTGTTALLLHLNGDVGDYILVDSSPNNWQDSSDIWGNWDSFSDTQVKFGATSWWSGGDSNISTGDVSFEHPTGLQIDEDEDFTIEFWNYITKITNVSTPSWVSSILNYRTNNAATLMVTVRPNNGNSYELVDGATQTIYGSLPLSMNTWQHVAVVRLNGVITLYIDGTPASGTWNTTQAFTYDRVGFGAARRANTNMYIDEIRVTKNGAVYTAAFTPPTSAFT